MHNSFIIQQHVCYTTILNMSVRSQPAYCTAVYRGWRYQRLWWYNWSSWGWAACFSSSGGPIVSPQPLVSSSSVNSCTICRLRADWHVEDRSVTYILLKNKGFVH